MPCTILMFISMQTHVWVCMQISTSDKRHKVCFLSNSLFFPSIYNNWTCMTFCHKSQDQNCGDFLSWAGFFTELNHHLSSWWMEEAKLSQADLARPISNLAWKARIHRGARWLSSQECKNSFQYPALLHR